MRYHSVVIEVEVTVGSSGQCGLTPLGCHPFQASTFAGNRLVIVIVELPDHILGFDPAKEHLTLLVDRHHGSAGGAARIRCRDTGRWIEGMGEDRLKDV